MKVISNDWSGEEDIILEEYLEPQGAFYAIKQKDSIIELGNSTRVKEIIKTLQFLVS